MTFAGKEWSVFFFFRHKLNHGESKWRHEWFKRWMKWMQFSRRKKWINSEGTAIQGGEYKLNNHCHSSTWLIRIKKISFALWKHGISFANRQNFDITMPNNMNWGSNEQLLTPCTLETINNFLVCCVRRISAFTSNVYSVQHHRFQSASQHPSRFGFTWQSTCTEINMLGCTLKTC